MDHVIKYDSPLGAMTIASDGEALTGLWFDGQKYFASVLEGDAAAAAEETAKADGRPAALDETVRWLDIYFSGGEPDFTPEIRFKGTDFRRNVWEALMDIPYGETVTYGQLAGRLGLEPAAARAVGGAVGHNPVSVIVPCHRVVGADGGLTGYAGGVEKKAALLKLESGALKIRSDK